MVENLLMIGPGAMIIAVLVGLSIGSFLNVVVHRLPTMQQQRWRDDAFEILTIEPPSRATYNLAWPRSHCPTCHSPIPIWQNIPVVSFVLLRGACRKCGSRIPLRYLAVEAGSGLIALFCAARWGFNLEALSFFLFFAMLVAISLIDWDTGFIPDEIALPLVWFGLVNAGWIASHGVLIQDAIIGAIAGYLTLWLIFWAFKLSTGRDGMGYGDFKLLAAVGAWVGWQHLPTVVLIAALAGLAFAAVRYLRTRDVGPLPFGPFLSLGGVVTLIVAVPT